MILKKQPKRGDKIAYKKEIMFKGAEKATSTVAAVVGNRMLLENGDEILFIINKK